VLIQKQKMKKPSKFAQARTLIGVVAICVLLILATVINSVRADQFDEQIRALQSQNDSNQAASSQLAAQASSYQDAINKLQAQISALQAAIVANQQKSEELKNQIIQAQADLDQQKKVLGENIKAMYLEGKTSTLEMLASSKNLSDFVDREQSRNAVQSKVKDTMAKITALQQQLKNQQEQLQQLIKDQHSIIDPWGMYNRECVSYTAWKAYQTFGHMPYWGGVGNANQWPADARNYGIPTGTVPRVHSVAISMGGAYGHAMWVEAVSGNTIYVSQYNYDLAGHYSEMSINGSGLTYIYFQ
jgi:surface antigen